MRVLVTGGAGNMARYCVPELVAHGHEVMLLARRPPDETRNPWTPDAPVLLGDLTDASAVLRAFADTEPEAVLHLGAIIYDTEGASVREEAAQKGVEIPSADATMRVNLLGTYTVMKAACATRVRSVVFGSTISVLHGSEGLCGRVERVPIDEHQPTWPVDSYGLSKRLGERMLESFSAAHGIQTISLRLEWIYMPHEPSGFEMGNPELEVTPADDATSFPLAYWQYVDVRDAASASRLALEDDSPGSSEIFFLATDRTTVPEHRELLTRFYPRLAERAQRMGPDDLVVSIRRLRERLGYVPRHSWRGADAAARVY
jgi:nucleoside-diphosphate-sugar epimerase